MAPKLEPYLRQRSLVGVMQEAKQRGDEAVVDTQNKLDKALLKARHPVSDSRLRPPLSVENPTPGADLLPSF